MSISELAYTIATLNSAAAAAGAMWSLILTMDCLRSSRQTRLVRLSGASAFLSLTANCLRVAYWVLRFGDVSYPMLLGTVVWCSVVDTFVRGAGIWIYLCKLHAFCVSMRDREWVRRLIFLVYLTYDQYTTVLYPIMAIQGGSVAGYAAEQYAAPWAPLVQAVELVVRFGLIAIVEAIVWAYFRGSFLHTLAKDTPWTRRVRLGKLALILPICIAMAILTAQVASGEELGNYWTPIQLLTQVFMISLNVDFARHDVTRLAGSSLRDITMPPTAAAVVAAPARTKSAARRTPRAPPPPPTSSIAK